SRLYALAPSLGEPIAEAVLACVMSDDALVAVRATLFFTARPTLLQAGRLPEIHERDPERFLRLQNPSEAGKDLRDWLLQAVAMRLRARPDDQVTREFARASALGPGDRSPQLLGALRDVDAGWVKANANALASAHPNFKP